MKVFPNWPLLELFCFCPKRDSGKDTEGSGFALWSLLVLWLSTGHPLFIAAQCVPWWPLKMGRVYKAKQDLCSEDFMIFWSTFGSYRKQQSSHHCHCTESSSSWGKVYFSELLHSQNSLSGWWATLYRKTATTVFATLVSCNCWGWKWPLEIVQPTPCSNQA